MDGKERNNSAVIEMGADGGETVDFVHNSDEDDEVDNSSQKGDTNRENIKEKLRQKNNKDKTKLDLKWVKKCMNLLKNMI